MILLCFCGPASWILILSWVDFVCENLNISNHSNLTNSKRTVRSIFVNFSVYADENEISVKISKFHASAQIVLCLVFWYHTLIEKSKRTKCNLHDKLPVFEANLSY